MLPRGWHGVWRGTLKLSPPPTGFPPTVPMELRITATGGFAIVYDGKERPYELRAAPGEPGRFLLDEKNGIVLEGFLDGDTLHFAFDVDGTLLVTRYVREKRRIHYEVRTYRPGAVTRPEGGANKVTTLRHTSVQSAVLTPV